MSQTQAAPAPAPATPAAGPGAPAVTAPQPATPARRTSDTPRRLRRLQSGVLALGIAFAVAAALTFGLLYVSLGRAADSTAQLVRVQQVQTNLLSADANATNAFLLGGLEPAAQRQAYDEAIDSATTLVAEAARAEPADEQALAQLNEDLVAYTVAIEQARSNNRQGFPVGAQYLRVASTTLRADALPLLDTLVATNATRARSQMGAGEAVVFLVIGLGVVAALVAAQVWLARRFHRRINVGLLLASAVAALGLIAGAIGLSVLAAQVREIRDGAFTDVNAAATARIQASNAKANESLTLVARGSGAAFEKQWQASAARVDEVSTTFRDLDALWADYTAVHTKIRKLDDGGDWDAAVALATSTRPGGSNAAFATFDDAADALLQSARTEAQDGLRGSRIGLVIGGLLLVAAGIAAAVLGRRGVAERLREYR